MKVTLANGLELTLPPLHVMVMGPPNSGKSRFASTAEKPMLVLAADPPSKMLAYHDRGLLDPEAYTGQFGQPIRLVKSVKTSGTIIQIEGYYDEDDEQPRAMDQFLSRLSQVTDEVRKGMWKTVVVDSWSQLEWIARARRTAGPFAAAANDSPYFRAMDDLQSAVNSRLMHLPCNLIVTFHIDTKVTRDKKGTVIKDARQDVGGGEMSYGIRAIGQLKDLGSVFGECYLTEAPIDGSDNYYLQTRRDANFRTLCSRIGAPPQCPNDWNSLFGPWIEREAAKLAGAAALAKPTTAEAAS